jgi:hypothetical protein
MDIILGLINKTLIVAFVLSILVISRHIFLFYRNIVDIEPKKYTLTQKELIYLGLSTSYIITCIINGINI